jgi:hypothetical protein
MVQKDWALGWVRTDDDVRQYQPSQEVLIDTPQDVLGAILRVS